ncbi:hypothetical protein DFH08DRAFT_978697 [Mycena albidolilacea]|uniref:Uncharacterized protein n=1 Tax=Mycena albidolilacea TaxID=1033008 RepID=A0AAD6YYZ6_9AGAR|nr:hypothetical protein DFH08DRAFT_978697 [Mycena albidolilacea]
MSYSHLANTPDFRNRRSDSHQFSNIVPIVVPGQLTFDNVSGIISSLQDLRSRAQPRFEESRPLRPNAPTMWSRPPLDPEACGAALRPQQFSFSPTGSHYPGQEYPQLMEFREYDRQSGGSSMRSPTPNRRRVSYQPATTTAIIEEVQETYDPTDPLEQQPAPAVFPPRDTGVIYPHLGPRVPTAPLPAIIEEVQETYDPTDPLEQQPAPALLFPRQLTKEKVELKLLLLTNPLHNPLLFPLGLFRLRLLGPPALPEVVVMVLAGAEEVEAHLRVVCLRLIPPFRLDFLPVPVLRLRIQDLVAVEVVAVVVADHLVWLRLQVLQVLPVRKGLPALHFIFRLHIILS